KSSVRSPPHLSILLLRRLRASGTPIPASFSSPAPWNRPGEPLRTAFRPCYRDLMGHWRQLTRPTFMPAQLGALDDGPRILVDKPLLLLGRHPECDIQIESRKISRRHCCIAQIHDYLVVRDLDSTNGIRINGVRVVEGKLKPGDELTIGNHRYRVQWDDAPVRPLVPPRRAAAG